jgi:hypothetical protein
LNYAYVGFTAAKYPADCSIALTRVTTPYDYDQHLVKQTGEEKQAMAEQNHISTCGLSFISACRQNNLAVWKQRKYAASS